MTLPFLFPGEVDEQDRTHFCNIFGWLFCFVHGVLHLPGRCCPIKAFVALHTRSMACHTHTAHAPDFLGRVDIETHERVPPLFSDPRRWWDRDSTPGPTPPHPTTSPHLPTPTTAFAFSLPLPPATLPHPPPSYPPPHTCHHPHLHTYYFPAPSLLPAHTHTLPDRRTSGYVQNGLSHTPPHTPAVTPTTPHFTTTILHTDKFPFPMGRHMPPEKEDATCMPGTGVFPLPPSPFPASLPLPPSLVKNHTHPVPTYP